VPGFAVFMPSFLILTEVPFSLTFIFMRLYERRRRRIRRIKVIATTLVVSFVILGLGAWGVYLYFTHDLPRVDSLKDYTPPIISTAYSDAGEPIGEFFTEKRVVVPIEEIPRFVLHAFLSAEDARFFQHEGLDYPAIVRAFLKNIQAGEIVQGGSTITQQVARSLLLSSARKWSRKIREAILANRMEKSLSKEEILYLYLNQIYLGHGAYGVEAASQNYFGKHVKDLNLAEAAMIAGLPQAPSRNSPYNHPRMAKLRQAYVLDQMVENDYITREEAEEALKTILEIHPRRSKFLEVAPYFTEHIRRYVEEKYGRDMLYKGGLQIFTALDVGMQKAAQQAVHRGLKELDKRQGYRGPIRHLEPEEVESFCKEVQQSLDQSPLTEGEEVVGVVAEISDREKAVLVKVGERMGRIELEDMKWARKPDPEVPYYQARVDNPRDLLQVGDVIKVKVKGSSGKTLALSLEQDPLAHAALLSIDLKTGYVKAMVGGRDFQESQFNRAVQARRQAGSAFKPIIYASAIDGEYTAATVIIDSPIIYDGTKDYGSWKPRNYEEKFYGPTTLRKALAKSRNVITVKIVQDIGIPYVTQYAHQLGIESPLNEDLSMALGSSSVSLLELTRAYSVFANQGHRVEPIFIKKIADKDGNTLEENLSPAQRTSTQQGDDLRAKADGNSVEQVISPETAYIITNLLEGVIRNGTGWRAKALGRPAAGKTGTTDDYSDAWFMGYTPDLITGVWVGFDQEEPLGKDETGSRAACPIWLDYMKTVLEGKPIKHFPVPERIIFAKIDPETGLLASPSTQNPFFECFKEGTAPTRSSEEKPSRPTEFFKFDMDRPPR
jgi:penicillin-binding protein 1A